jgi:hypothetical protein
MERNTDFKALCATKGGVHCDLHFLVENEVMQTSKRVDKLEEKTTNSFDTLSVSLNDMVIQMKTFINSQEFRDKSSSEMRTLTLENTTDINDLKSSLKSVVEHNKNVTDVLAKIDRDISSISGDIKDLDKTVLGRDEVTSIVKNAIVVDKNSGRDQWFESLPAKVSAGVALISFIAFFTIKIVVMLLAI